MSPNVMTGGEAAVRSLAAHGVDCLFGIPGNHNIPIYGHLGDYGIRHVLARHEQGVGYAADAWARATGRPAVALVTTGPAVLNALAALGQSYVDSTPVLLLAPGMPTGHPAAGNGTLHELRSQLGAARGVVASAERVETVAEVPEAIARAFAAMDAPRPRPAYVEIALDVLEEAATCSDPRRLASTPSTPSADAIREAAELLDSSPAVGILIGGGARGAARPISALAERLDACIVTTMNGKGILDESHARVLGAGSHLPAARAWMAGLDALVVVGSDLGPADQWNGPLPAGPRMVRIDTDEEQLRINAEPRVGICADATLATQRLLEALGPRTAASAAEHPEIDLVAADARQESAPWRAVAEAVSRSVGPGDLVVGDSAKACYYGLRTGMRLGAGSAFLYPSGSGTLGYAIPGAVGAAIARPDRRVVAVMGDGGAMFSLAELAVAVQERLPIAFVVVDNSGYAQIRENMTRADFTPLGTDFPAPDFVALARALGCAGEAVRDGEELHAVIRSAFERSVPTVILIREEDAS